LIVAVLAIVLLNSCVSVSGDIRSMREGTICGAYRYRLSAAVTGFSVCREVGGAA